MFDEIKSVINKEKNTALQYYEFIKCKLHIPSVTDINQKLENQTLIILDGFMTKATDSKDNTKKLNEIATRDCHREDFFNIFTCQNLNYEKTKLRTARTNSKYIIMLNNVGDNRNLKTILFDKRL